MSANEFTQWFPWTSKPLIMNAPMLGTAYHSMAAAVTKAGGLGLIGGGFIRPDLPQLSRLDAELSQAASLLSVSKGDTLPIGVGFITFDRSLERVLEIAGPLLEKWRVAAVWLFAPDPSSPSVHASLIPAVKKLGKAWGLKVFVQVGSVAAARDAVNDGADVIVAQGVDAGGHQWAQGAGLITLVPEIRDMLDKEFEDKEVALCAAGGIMDGRGVVAALSLGAEGIAMGTRFVVTKESASPESTKDVILKAVDGGSLTIKSTLHDDFQGPNIWPKLYDGRAIKLASWKDHENGMSLEDNREIYNAAMATGNEARRTIWAGTGIGLIKDIPSVEDLMRTTFEEIRQTLSRMSRM